MAQQAQDGIDPSVLKTPERCVADFCLIPVRTAPISAPFFLLLYLTRGSI